MPMNHVVTIKTKLIELIINLSETTCEWTPLVHISTSPIQESFNKTHNLLSLPHLPTRQT